MIRLRWISLFLLLIGQMALAQAAPVLYYTDLPGGMCAGGQNNQGHIVTINGKNFGDAADATHYVTVAGAQAAAYVLWQDNKIAFQPGCAVADGDYTITVTTPAGTSNKLPFHIYSGSTIYFVDNVAGHGGSDSNPGTYTAPFGTLTKCRTMAMAAAGNTCYLMPGFTQITNEAGMSCFLCLRGAQGTQDKYIGVIGYPTADSSQVPQISFVGGISVPATDVISSKYVVIANFKTVGNNGYEAVRLGTQASAPDRGDEGAVHHIRVINIDQTLETTTAITALQTILASHIQVYGLVSHDIDNSVGGKHVGHVYIGDSSHDIDFGWSTFDGSCLFNSPNPCHSGKQFEVHVTWARDYLPTPAQPPLTAVGGGALAAGTYDVAVNYRSHRYDYTSHSLVDTFTPLSTVQTITIDGSGSQNAIEVTHPTGFQRPPTQDDGDTVVCNPSLAYQVYACLRSSPGTPCAPGSLQRQVDSPYTNTTVYDSISGTDFTLTSLASGGAPPTLVDNGDLYNDTRANITGCNIYNLAVHDSQFIDAADYALPIGANSDSTAPHYMRFYNNLILNAANNSNAPNCCDFDGGAFTIAMDFTWQAPGGGRMDFLNNTFYNSGSLHTYWTPSVFGLGYWDAAIPPLTLNFVNNIFYQPQAGQKFQGNIGPYANFTITGSNNLCYAPLNSSPDNACPASWNSAGGLNGQDPLFTSLGILTVDPSGTGGPIWANPNVRPQAGSPAIDAGYDTTSVVTRDILGVLRPQNGFVDIGGYEYFAGLTADLVPPVVSISSPSAGTVSATMTLTATCSDNIAVSTLQFTLDGQNFGGPFTGAGQHSRTVGTDTLTSGSHSIGAICTDSSGNTASATPVVINVSTTVSRSVAGTDFTFSVKSGSSDTAQVSAGTAATYSLTLQQTTTSLLSVSLTCSGAPAGATCTVTPNPTSLSGSTASTVTVGVSTAARPATAASIAPANSMFAGNRGSAAHGLAMVFVPGIVFAFGSIRSKRAWRRAMIGAALLLMLALAGCGGTGTGTAPARTTSAGTPAGSYTLTVTATAGTISHAVTLKLSVN